MNENNFDILWPSELEITYSESLASTAEPIRVSENMQPVSGNNDPSTVVVVAAILALGVVGAIINDRVK
jgi:hypothetical protein